MPKQLNVNLAFTADTGAAKAQIKSLEQDLKNLVSATGATKDFKLTKDLVQAKEAAGQLRLALQNATTSTGTLDLSKFDQAIKASGMKLSEYRQHLSSLGPAGQQAFAKMAQSIIQAEVPLRKTNALLDNLKTTMINTARWQLSSSMLHGFMGALQSAYGYAQDLNSSLNNIRIVTGASVDEMTAFADRANKAAQALSTSTTQYTDAALIYYQQGIRDQEEIAGRTETTIKLANVSRQSAEEVSQQMTAIWNNFYDGSKSLEYYADAITALGATTASSSQEIATGLEKFAAISKTVGLSYEYATAALATITAQTRQSADTVGTGLRTLFSRLEGLKLGETLEDGVDLNKYSQALEAVGVQVLDVSGDMRNMDDILNDLGARWGDLTQAQKMALAQTVGGVRQYTNLIALMDNWDKMQQNVLTAQGSEGTLQEQADIYAESWEAAQKRVKAAAQALYSDLLDDKFFIGLANGFAKILQGVDGLIDGIGGLRTLLPGVLLLFNQLWGKQMSQNIDNMIFNMSRNTDAMQKQIAAQKQEAYNEASAMFKGSDTYMGQAQEQALKSQLDLSFQLQGAAKNLTAEEIQRYQASIDTVSAIQDQVVALGQAADAANKAKDAQIDALTNKAIRSGGTIEEKQTKLDQSQTDLQNIEKQVTASTNASKALQNLQDQYSKGEISALGFAKAIKGIQADLRNAGFDRYGASVQTLQKAVNAAKTSTQAFDEQIKKIVKDKGFENNAYIDTITHMENLANQYGWTAEDCEKYLNILHKNIDAGMEFGQAQEIAAEAVQKLKDKITNAESAMQTLGTTGQTIVQIFSGMSQFMMGLSSIVNVFETLSNPDISGLEKFKTVIMGLSLGLPMLIKGGQSLINTFKSINTAIEGATVAQIKNTAATEADTIVSGKNLIVKGMMKAAELLQIGLLRLRLGAQAVLTAMEGEATVVTWLLTAAVNALNISLSVSPVMLLVAALVALVAIGGIVVGVVKAISNAWNAHNTAAENAETAAANLQKQFQETKQAYDDLKTSIEDYQGSLNAIEQLQKGTQEWKDAIRDSNTEALALIDSLGLIKDVDYTIDKDGVIKINEDVLDEALDKKAQAANTAQTNALMGQVTAKQTRAQADAENIARDSGQYAIVNTAIDRLVNGDLKDQFSKNALSDDELKQKLDINDDELIASIKENAQAQLQAADQYTMASEQAAKSIVDNNKEIQNSGYAEEITKAAGGIYEQVYDASYDKYAESLSLGISETVFDQFAQLSGLDQLNGFKSEGGGKYSYVDENGERQKAKATAEEIAMTLAAADAERQLSETSSGLIGAFKKLDEAGTVGSQALKKFLSDGDLNGASKSELDMVSAHTKNGAQTADYLGQTLGGEDKVLSDEEAQALGYESAKTMVEAFNNGLYNAQDNIANAGKDLIPKFMQDAFDAVSENSDLGINGKTAIAGAIDSALESGGNEAAKKLMNQFMEASQAGELTDAKIEEIIASAEELSAVDLETLTNQIAEINSIISDLETGDSISADDYAKLSEEQQSYFAMAMDGTYQLIGSAEELRDITSETNFEKFKQMGSDATNTANTYNSAANIAADQGVDALSQSAYIAGMPGTGGQGFTYDASLLETQLGLVKEYQTELDISNAKLAEWQEQLANNTVDPSMLKDVASAIGDLNLSEEGLAQGAADATAKQQELQTAMALSAENTNELQAMLEDGSIGPEAFNQGFEKLRNTLDEDIDVDQYKELSNYFEEFGDEIDGVSKDMKGNKKASRELAKEISRFDAAITSVGENYNDWMTDLKKGDKNSTTHAKTIKGLRNAYGDLLDVSGDSLSKNFLENAENLDLMARAAEGDEEAYNQLQQAMQQDIESQLNLDDTDFFDKKAEVQAAMDEMNFQDIEVGAKLDDADFLNSLTEMVNAAGMTADQATSYLASMGIDAEVVEDTSTDTETNEVTGYTASGGTVTRSYSIPKVSGSGEDMSVNEITGTASFPYFTVQPDTQTVTTQKENKSFGLKVTSANKSSGGGFKHANSSGGGGGGGGGCFIAGTLISTSRGFIPIEQIHQGDIVLSYDEQMHKNVYSPVVKTMIHALWTNIYTINIGIEQLKATEIHPFYIKRAGIASWLPASELRAGDLVLLASGIWKEIDEIKIKFQFKIVYNFEVSNTHNYYVGKTQILAHNKGGGRRRGGGGRRAERNRAANIRTNEDLDRYHVVTTKLSKLESQLKKVSTAYDRAFGNEKLKLLDKQIQKQEQLIATQKEYTGEIEDYLKKDKKRFAKNDTEKFWSDTARKTLSVKTDAAHYLGMEVEFDENGTILNYKDLVKAANKKYNAAAKKYRSTKQGNKKAEIAWEKAQAQRDGFLENLAQLEETQQLYLDQKQAEQEMINELYDMKLEETQLIVKLQVDVEDDKLKTLDHLLNRIGDDAYKAAERISLLGKQAESSFAKIEAYNKGVQGLFSNHGISVAQLNSESAGDLLKLIENGVKDGSGNSFTEAEADALREWIDGYREQLDSLIEMRTDIIEEIGTVMEENIKRLDRISDKMEHLKSIANSYRNIVDLTGRQYLKINSQLYDAMSATSVKLATQSVDMAKTRMEQANQQYDTLRNNYAKIVNQLSDAEKRRWEEQLNSAAEYTQEMTENYYSSWEEAIEAVNERFELAMQNMAEDFNRLMGGAIGNLEGLANRMDLRKNVQDVLVPEYEKMYQLSKLANEAQKAIDGSNNIKVQKELQKVQDKILKAREDGKAMSEYEIQYLEKELELKKAQMALEEAAAIKSQVRMTRDSEGNFSYVYTADTKAVEDAENDYNAKLYEMQKLNEEYIQDLQFQIVDVEQQYISAMQEAADMYGIGTAEYYAAIANIQADYQEYFTSLNEQLDIALTNQTETADEHAKFYEELTGDVYQANVVLTTSWEDTMLAAMTGFETLQEYQNMWDESTAQVFDDAQNAGLAWQEGMDEVYEAAGTSIEGYAETVGSAFTQIIEQGNETAEEMHTMADEADSAIEQIVNAVVSWEEQMSQSIEQMMQSCDQLIDKLNELLALMSEVGASSLDAEIAEMESKLATAKENTAKARRKKDDARAKKDTARTKKRKAYRRVGRKIRTALKRVRRARTALRNAKRRLAVAKRRGSRRAIAAAKRRVTRAKRKLTNARRTLRTTIKRASRRQRTAYKRYRKKVKQYRKAAREYSARKAIYNTAKAEQTNIEQALTALYEQRDAQQKAQELTDQNEKESQETQTGEIDATTVAAAVDANTSSLENALKNIAFSPTIRIDTLPELKQDVNITATFPNVTGSEEVIETLTKGLGELASMYANRQ